jgi:alcohol dehydrogenase class IV
MRAFDISRLPRIVFGAGSCSRIPSLVAGFGRHALLVTGARSFRASEHWTVLSHALQADGIAWDDVAVATEPSPELVDDTVRKFHGNPIDAVIGIGGGSALDAAKAIAGLLLPGNSVMDHLEGVGPELPYRGPAVPFIAVPTTAGTGSEATKNAVLSVRGEGGFKKSFRDGKLVAEYAVIDPDLLASCPPEVVAANGMDALTQLLESYVSIKVNPFTDALALSGLAAVRDGLLAWYEGDDGDGEARARMAYAALLSGITLAQAGLGSVHGLASPLGAFFPIPHGVVCGTLVAAATRANLEALHRRAPEDAALAKYAEAGRVLAGDASVDDQAARDTLLSVLDDYTTRLDLPRLAAFGARANDIDRVVAGSRGSSMKTNPIVLDDAEIAKVLAERI